MQGIKETMIMENDWNSHLNLDRDSEAKMELKMLQKLFPSHKNVAWNYWQATEF